MERKFEVIIAIIFIVLGGVWYFFQGSSLLTNTQTNNNQEYSPTAFIPEGEETLVLYHQKNVDNTHTYSGFIALATPCEEIESTVAVEKKLPENATIDITTKPGSDFCAQVVSKKSFSISFSASDAHTITLHVNSISIPIKVIEGTLPSDEQESSSIELQ